MDLHSPGPPDDRQRLLLGEPDGDEASEGCANPARPRVQSRLFRTTSAALTLTVEHACSLRGLLLCGFLYAVPSAALWFTAVLLAARPFRYCGFMVWLPLANALGLAAAVALLVRLAVARVRGPRRAPPRPAKVELDSDAGPTCCGAVGCLGGALLRGLAGLLAGFALLCSPWMAAAVLRFHLTAMDWDVVTQLQAVDGVILIERDATGLPGVVAVTPADVSFAQGYLHARDQLFRMELQRLAVHGQLSTLLGPPAVPADVLARTLDLTALARATLAGLSPGARRHCEAYAAGVNAATGSREFRWSPEFYLLWHTPPPWEAEDVVLTFKLFQWLTTTVDDAELARWQLFAVRNLSHADIEQLFPLEKPSENFPVPAGDEQQLQQFYHDVQATVQAEARAYTEVEGWLGRPGTTPGRGWTTAAAGKVHPTVVSPSQLPGHQRGIRVVDRLAAQPVESPSQGLAFLRRTVGYWAGGVAWAYRSPAGAAHTKPFLAYEATGSGGTGQLWYPMTLAASRSAPAKEVHTLVTYPGLPGSLMGSNDALAWGSTLLFSDQTDYFVLSPTGANSYLHNGSVVEYDTFDHLIEVRGAAAVPLRVQRSRYGPVVTDALRLGRALPIAISCEALQADPQGFEAFVSMGTARSAAEFQAHLRGLNSPALATVLVEGAGAIVYATSGGHRKRAVGHSGRYPIPGTGQYDYVGRIDPADTPSAAKHAGGFIAAGNAPTAGGMAAGVALGHEWRLPHRYERVSQLLQLLGSRPSAADHMLVQTDAVDAFAVRDFRALLDQLPVPAASDAQSQLREVLEFWDGQQDGGADPQLFAAFRNKLTTELMDWAYEAADSHVDRYWPLDDSGAIVAAFSRPSARLKQHCAAALSRDPLPDVCMAWAAGLWVSLAKPPAARPAPTAGPPGEGCAIQPPALRHGWWGRQCACLWDRPLAKLGGRHTVSAVRCAAGSAQVEIPTLQLVLDTNSGYTLLQLPLGHSSNPFDPHYDDWTADYARNEYRLVSPT